ncbi:hypothetical protein LFM09_40660 [Lentzea alba]|uniref:hypothetical protein n=1 Tax=Lentzea alba TaxID=2714351 RepID=UPI0039BF2F02
MPSEITFFLAPDDETAALTRNSRPGRALRSLTFHGFDPDDAVVEWTRYFEAPGRQFADDERLSLGNWPRYVADFLNDGVGVFIVPENVLVALAAAGPDELRGLVGHWGEFLVRINDDELTTDEKLAVVEGVAQLAAAAVASAGQLRLYCWQF